MAAACLNASSCPPGNLEYGVATYRSEARRRSLRIMAPSHSDNIATECHSVLRMVPNRDQLRRQEFAVLERQNTNAGTPIQRPGYGIIDEVSFGCFCKATSVNSVAGAKVISERRGARAGGGAGGRRAPS